jgi:mRNA guanylyltransferase
MFTPYQELYKLYPAELEYVPFVVEMKQMQFGYGIEMMFRQILPNLPHGNDGLIFTCRNSNYKHGTDPHILKWKPEAENSVDFRLSLDFPLVQPDEVDLAEGVTEPYYDYDVVPVFNLLVHISDGQDQWYGTMHVPPAEWESMKALNEPLDDRIVECSMDAQKRWRFMRWRDDKANANHISTVESVIESITDRVTKRELIGAAKRIRDEWKRRLANKEAANRGGGDGGGGAATGANGMPVGLKRKAEDQHTGRPSPGPNNGMV